MKVGYEVYALILDIRQKMFESVSLCIFLFLRVHFWEFDVWAISSLSRLSDRSTEQHHMKENEKHLQLFKSNQV